MSVFARASIPLTAIILTAALLVCLSIAVGGETEHSPDGAIRFHRVLAPEDRMKDWPIGGEKYIPIDSDEFDHMTSAMKPRTLSASAAPLTAISASHYDAKLVGEHLLGRGTLDVVAAGSRPTLLPFDACNLAIREVVWDGSTDRHAKSNRVALGLNNDGRSVVVVEHSGRINFEWSLVGRRNASEAIAFSIELPASPANRFDVDLPVGFTPTIDAGSILGNEAAGKDFRRWSFELGGHDRFQMRVAPPGTSHQRRQLASLQEQRTYDCSLRGVEVSVQWKLQSPNEPLQQITAILDPGLQLVSARLGETAIPWSAAHAADGSGTRVTLRLPDAIRGTQRTVRLGAIGRPTLGRPWRLPRIRAENVLWQESNISLFMPEPLATDRIAATGCVQTGVGQLSAPRVGQSMQFQAFDPEATVEVLFSRRPAHMKLLCASDVELDGEEATARVTAEFSITDEAQFVVNADVARHWLIDSVESTISGGVVDWSIEPSEHNGSRLSIRLASAILPARPARVTIVGRRLFSPSEQRLGTGDLMPIHFRGVAQSKRWIAVQTTGPHALNVYGDERLKRLKAGDLEKDEQSLFAEQPRHLLFEYASRSASVAVSLAPRKTTFAGTVRVDAAIGPRTVREKSAFHYIPQAGHVDRVLVRFSSRRDESPRWKIVGDGAGLALARRWTDAEQTTAGVEKTMETWELTLRRPQDGPFEIVASRETPVAAASIISLASMPEADSQQGIVSVRSVDGAVFRLESSHMKPMLPESPSDGRPQTVRGKFEYDPNCESAKGMSPAIRILSANEADAPSAWIAEGQLESWYQADGAVRHSATYHLQSFGRKYARLTMPPDVTRENIRAVWLDGAAVAWRTEPANARGEKTSAAKAKLSTVQVSVELPVDRRAVCINVEWTAANPPLGAFGTLSYSVPTPDAPMFSQHWTVWLPPGYECIGDEPSHDPQDDAVQQSYPGWSLRKCEISAAGPNALRYYRGDSMRLLGIVAILPVIGSIWWIFRIRRRRTSDPASSTTVAANGSRTPADSASTVSGVITSIALFAAITAFSCFMSTQAVGAELSNAEEVKKVGSGMPGTDKRSKINDTIYRVFVPVDAKKKPVGSKVYVPETFYRELFRRAAPTEKPSAWLILNATYRGELSREPVSDRLTINVLRARYKIRVSELAARVRIPLRADGVNLMPGGVLLDGQPVESEWEPNAAALAFKVDEPGDYRVEILLRPTIRCNAGTSGFEVGVPRVATAGLELTIPSDAPPIEIPSALGEVRLEKSSPQLTADLGPTNRLTVRWQEATAAGMARSNVEVEQLLWLNVQPGAVSIAARLKLRAAEGQFQQVRLAVDPSLRLLPLSGDNQPATNQPTVYSKIESNQTRIITFRWPRPISDQVTLDVSFLLSGVSAVGNIRLPHFELLDISSTKRWLGVSVASTLDYDEQIDGKIGQEPSTHETATVSDFLKLWGTTSSSPTAVYRLPDGEIQWTLATRPRKPRIEADQTLHLNFDEDRIDVFFDAHLSVASGNVFQYRIAAPKGLIVEHISVLEGDADCVERWSQDANGVTVFLNSAATGSQYLSMHGRLPVRMGEKHRLPAILMNKCEIRSATTRVVQRPTVLLTLDGVLHNTSKSNADREVEPIVWNGSQPPAIAFTMKPNRMAASAIKTSTIPRTKSAGQPKPLKPKNAASVAGVVRLADVMLLRQADDVWRSAVAFDIEPNGEDTLDVHLPSDCKLIQATVENMPVVPLKIGGNVWRLPSASRNSSQRVDVFYEGISPASNSKGQLLFESPTLNGWTAKRTIWTVFTPPDWTVGEPQNAMASSDERIAANRVPSYSTGDRLTEQLRQTLTANYATWSYLSENQSGSIALKISPPQSQTSFHWLVGGVVCIVLLMVGGTLSVGSIGKRKP